MIDPSLVVGSRWRHWDKVGLTVAASLLLNCISLDSAFVGQTLGKIQFNIIVILTSVIIRTRTNIFEYEN